jgi:hypothetical protein
VIYQPVIRDDSDGKVDEVKEEVSVVVDADTVEDPGAMAGWSARGKRQLGM